ncbi:hypothetical protein Gohar_000786 [Gossypium harknessii]|uniref:Uncharacterized protein n=1 Tax=Gossypium harknessii TaxID=34285 RepID=A0A7J9I2I7_9ROSI|nr:hypothetical protein [Gossypium harknessii]
MRNFKGIWENVKEREWTNFCLLSEEPTVILIVQEFYLTLNKQKQLDHSVGCDLL